MDPAPTISVFIRLPIRTAEEVAGIWIATATKSGMVVRMIDVFVPLDKRETLPVAGDWNGRGKARIGVFRPITGEWFLDLDGDRRLHNCSIDRCIASFGQQDDLPVIGDWNGTGISNVGIFRPSRGEWFLDRNGNGRWDGCDVDQCISGFGQQGDRPVAGDWNATGSSKIGVFRPHTGEWLLDMNGNGHWDGANTDKYVSGFGRAGDLPVEGKW